MCVSGAHGHAPAPEPVAYLVAVPLLMAYPEQVAGVPTRGPVAGAVGVLFLVASASPKPHHHIEHPARGQLLAWGMPVLAGLPVAGGRAGFRCACPASLGFEGGAVLPPPFNGTPCPWVCGVLAGLALSQLPAWCACRVPVGGAVGRVPTWWPCWCWRAYPWGRVRAGCPWACARPRASGLHGGCAMCVSGARVPPNRTPGPWPCCGWRWCP